MTLQVALWLLGAAATWTVTVAALVWWLSVQFKETRHTLRGAMDMRFAILDEKIDETNERVRQLEIKQAAKL